MTTSPKTVFTLLLLSFNLSFAQKAKLVRHTVMADGHPVAIWEKSSPVAQEAILLVHGRTWSAVPDFDLQVEGEDLSLMDGLVENGYAVYAVDLRGYGETPRDETGWMTPSRSAKDLAAVLSWIDKQKPLSKKPHLFGWSFGSTNSQLLTQRHPELISSLTLFGYWHDADEKFDPDKPGMTPVRAKTTAKAAASDFILPGTISENAIDAYVTSALKSDPVRVDVRHMSDFNELDPAKVKVPTLILQGEHDPIGPTDKQAKLYTRLGTAHKQWITVPGSDHAAFLETPRDYFIRCYVSFLKTIPNQK